MKVVEVKKKVQAYETKVVTSSLLLFPVAVVVSFQFFLLQKLQIFPILGANTSKK